MKIFSFRIESGLRTDYLELLILHISKNTITLLFYQSKLRINLLKYYQINILLISCSLDAKMFHCTYIESFLHFFL